MSTKKKLAHVVAMLALVGSGVAHLAYALAERRADEEQAELDRQLADDERAGLVIHVTPSDRDDDGLVARR